MDPVALTNIRIVTPGGVVHGSIKAEDGVITDVSDGESGCAKAIDAGGDLLIAGLVDIHTDNLEKHFMPRAGAEWDAAGAAMAHDGQMATAGVTTVFDSLSLHGEKNGLDRGRALPVMIDGVEAAEDRGALRIDHRIHLRCEVTNPKLEELVKPHLSNPRLQMLSVMDHTPGQRQLGSLDRWKEKQLAAGRTAEQIEANLEAMMSWREFEGADARRRMIAEFGRDRGISVASHDDATKDHIDTAFDLGCRIAEFPVSEEAAIAAKERGMETIMGGPNFVRGNSHSGNASARDVAASGRLDALCSDYVPLSMIRAAFMLCEPPFNWSLQDAMATVSAEPARMAGLHDRGTLETTKRADFVRVRYEAGGWPVIQGVWAKGRRAA